MSTRPRHAFVDGVLAPSRALVRVLAGLTASVLVATGLVVGVALDEARAADGIQLTATTTPSVLAGEDSSVTLSVDSISSVNFYNVTFRYELPTGVTYVDGSTQPDWAGDPKVYDLQRLLDPGDPPDVPPEYEPYQVLVWNNIADLPVGDDFSFDFAVSADPALYPVGSNFDGQASVYANSNPRLLTKFDSDAIVDLTSFDASDDVAAQATEISALQVTKSEPSPESELLRGVHDHTTEYTIRVRNTQIAGTDDVVLVDYLSAGLEFLGCGEVDNSSAVEYPGAADLEGTPAVGLGCIAPDSVDTVTDPAGYPAGVYTRIEWHLGDFAAGQAANISYAAGIPIRENTATWPGGKPLAAGLEQTANLDNNTGPLTRQSGDGTSYSNIAEATGTYTGAVALGQSSSVGDSDTHTVVASDVSLIKTADTSTFDSGGIAEFSLRIRVGEYTNAEDLVVTDVLPDGICALVPAGTTVSGTVPADCAAQGNAPVSNANVTSLTYNLDGTSTLVLVPTPDTRGPSDPDLVITYEAFMRTEYAETSLDAPTVSGDQFSNTADIAGQTTMRTGTDQGTDPVVISDDSGEALASQPPTIDKKILPRQTIAGVCPEAGYIDDAGTGTAFQVGDKICFELRVDFSDSSDTRNAEITDFVPVGTSYDDFAVGSQTTIPLDQIEYVADVDAPNAPLWRIGEQIGEHRYVNKGAVLVLYVSAIVADASSDEVVDITANLMKYRQESTSGSVLALRDAVDYGVAPPPQLEIDKKIVELNNVAVSGGPTDSVEAAGTDVVTQRITVNNAGTGDAGNNIEVDNIVVWDILPAGVICADISDLPAWATCFDDDLAPGYPGQNVIVFELPAALAAESTVFFDYDLTIREDTSVSTELTNTASIASFTASTTNGDDTTFVPADSVAPPSGTATTAAGLPQTTVTVPSAEVGKSVVTAITEGVNGTGDAVAGEGVEYTYAVTIPAHTTVYDAVLSDPLPAALAGSTTATADLPEGAVLGPGVDEFQLGDDGTLTFPAVYTNDTGTDQVFEVTLSGAIIAPDFEGSSTTNTARFNSNFTAGGTPVPERTASVTTDVVAPDPQVSKAIGEAAAGQTQTVAAGEEITYTVRAWNGTGAAHAHDVIVRDCLAPDLTFTGFETTPATVVADSNTSGTSECTTPGATELTWTFSEPLTATSGSPVVMTFTAIVPVAAAGHTSFDNSVTITGSSIADGDNDPGNEQVLTASGSVTATMPDASITKSVTPKTAAIGESIDYTLTVTLPADTNFYNAAILDVLPTGIAFDPSTATMTCETASSVDCAADLPPSLTVLTQSGSTYGWLLGDMLATAEERTVTVTVSATVADIPGNTAGTYRVNRARVGWDDADAADPTSAAYAFDEQTSLTSGANSADAAVRITEPSLSIAKTVTDSTPEPGDTFEYTVTVTNASGATRSSAFDAAIEDTVDEGIVVDPATLLDEGAVLTGADSTNGGGVITWNIDELAPGASATLTYSATLAPSLSLDGSALGNTADLLSYRSLDETDLENPEVRTYSGPEASRTVTPSFPDLVPSKAPTGSEIAYADEPFGWTVTVDNQGGTARDVTVVDTLPANWSYVADSAEVWVDGVSYSLEPEIDTSGSNTVLTWPAAGDEARFAIVTDDVVIRYQAEPSLSALVNPGVGALVPHTNTVEVTGDDNSGSARNDDGDYVGEPAEADAFIHSADVTLTKTTENNPVAGTTTNGVWQITVANAGPDTAVGPFTVTDVPIPMPSGILVASASGTGWSCGTPNAAGEFTCTRSDSLAADASFPPINVDVTVNPDIAENTTISNEASVTAKTHDPDTANNDDSATADVATEADLQVVKSVVGTVQAGETVTWTIAVSNLGPSTARGPITVTDDLPATGLSNVQVAAGTGWDCSVSGDEIECVHAGDLSLGAAPSISVSADLASSFTGDLENTATITGSGTTDPVPGNNSDTTTDEADTDTTIQLDKQLVSSEFVPGESVVYELAVTNTGAADARNVQIEDELPSGLTFVSSTSVIGTWTCSGTTTVECELTGTLSATAGSNVATVRITVDVASSVTGTVDNSATASADNASDATDTTGASTDEQADFQIVKTHPSGAVYAGSDLTYTIQVTNLGPSDSPGTITMTDTVPAGMTPTSASGTGWSCDIDTDANEVVCDHAAGLAADATAADIQIEVAIDPDAGPATLTNRASVSGPLPSEDTSQASTEDDTVITDLAVVTVTKTPVSATVVAGEQAEFTVTVSNAGPSTADSLLLADVLPTGMTGVSISGTGWTCDVALFQCTRATQAPGDTTLTVVALVASSVPDTTVLTNTAELSWSDSSGSHETDATADVTIDAIADLALTKNAPAEPGVAGSTATFLIEVENVGSSDAVGPVTVIDTLPAGMSYLSAGSDWTCTVDAVTPGGPYVECVLDGSAGIAAGASAPDLTLTVVLEADLDTLPLTNTATVMSGTDDADLDNNEDAADLPIAQLVDLSIEKTHTGPVRIGDPMVFDFVVANSGPSTATGVSVVDTLPPGLTFVSTAGTDAAWSCSNAAPAIDGTTEVTCDLSSPIDPGNQAPALSITARVEYTAYPSVDNQVTVSSPIDDADTTNDVDVDTVVVPPMVDLTIEKEHDGGVARVGNRTSWLITVTNFGPTEDPGGFQVIDSLPAGLSYTGFSGDDVTCADLSGTVTCVFDGPLGASDSRTVTIETAVGDPAMPEVVNVASVVSLFEDISTLPDTDDAAVSVEPPILPATGTARIALMLLAALAALVLGAASVLVVRRRRTA